MPRILASTLLLVIAIFVCSTSSAAVDVPSPAMDIPLAAQPGKESIVLAGGCFWGIQAVFQHVKGVISTTSGYSGGDLKSPSYEQVATGTTGHAESVEVVYDPSQVTLGELLKVFFSVAHDPTQLNRQGPDRGTDYRSAIFFSSSEQQKVASAYIDQLQKAKVFDQPVVTEVSPLKGFYPAERHHQNFAALHPDSPYIIINDAPKVANLKAHLPELYRDNKL